MKISDTHKIFRNLVVALAVITMTGALAADEPRVFTVDNTGGPHADFTDLQEAMDAAEDGDVFHVLGSPIEYGDVTVTRRVHLFGPGYNLARVYDEGYQEFHEAVLGNVDFTPTRTFNPLHETTPAGSSIEGFRTASVGLSASDVTVRKNQLNGGVRVITTTVENDVLEVPHRARVVQNYMTTFQINSTAGDSTGHVIANNIMSSSQSVVRNGTFRHNTVKEGGSNPFQMATGHPPTAAKRSSGSTTRGSGIAMKPEIFRYAITGSGGQSDRTRILQRV